MTGIAEFLAARLDDDDQDVLNEHSGKRAARRLAEVAAKRQILALHAPCHECWPGHPYCHTCADQPLYTESWMYWPCPTVRAVLGVWSGHPDFDPSWRMEELS